MERLTRRRATVALAVAAIGVTIGAAFALPIGVVSAPIRTHEMIVIERVDQRQLTDSLTWAKVKDALRGQMIGQLRQTRVREFLTNLRESAKIVDRRKEVEFANRRAAQ